jgi:hypothetical protein
LYLIIEQTAIILSILVSGKYAPNKTSATYFERDKYSWVGLLQLVEARGLGNTLIIFRSTHVSQAGLTQGSARQRRAYFLVNTKHGCKQVGEAPFVVTWAI